MTVHIYGIRHHGPGSARSLRQALEALQPDCVLVEGPPDADGVLPLLAHAEMRPPVALLIYKADEPQRAVFYPFAVFSPEWQAIAYGLAAGVPVRFMDLPQYHRLVDAEGDHEGREAGRGSRSEDAQGAEGDHRAADLDAGAKAHAAGLPAESHPGGSPASPSSAADEGWVSPAEQPVSDQPEETLEQSIRRDPLGWVASVAGYSDGERWWEHMVEHRQDSAGLFEAILELMGALRERCGPDPDPVEQQREAFMRQSIRAAERAGHQRIAVVCGAWHAPALAQLPPAAEDAALLRGLPRTATNATWVPWTYGRLSLWSGYGAGIQSPGWYHHLWSAPDNISTRWLARVAQLLREEDLDASSAHVIEAVRLAEALTAVRDRSLPGLAELNEAVQAVFCYGGDAPMRLIQQKLIVGELLGEVPPDTPMLPIQQDLQALQRRLRLQPEAGQRSLDLDLRKPNDLERSELLHRLNLLGVPWGKLERVSGKQGTFHEIWRLQWQPELAVALIEAGMWGNTVLDAATAFVRDTAARTEELPALTQLVERVLFASLPDAIGQLMQRLENVAALTSDVPHLMDALPALAKVLRYGNVRQTDTGAVGHVVDGLVTRICIGLPGACAALNDEAAQKMFERIQGVDGAIRLLQHEQQSARWGAVLQQLADQQSVHMLVAGRCCRLLFEHKLWPADELARRLGLALSPATDPPAAAAWIEGFLHGSGLLLLHNEQLWRLIDLWLAGLAPEVFTELLPLLRRTFSTFAATERRQMGELARQGRAVAGPAPGRAVELHLERAERVLPTVALLLGLDPPVLDE